MSQEVLSFDQALGKITEEIQAAARETMNRGRGDTLEDLGPMTVEGEIDFYLKIKDGKAAEKAVKYGGGYPVYFDSFVDSPEGKTLYSGDVKSSDGGGIDFHDKSVKEHFNFDCQTSFWHNTTFSLHGETSPPLPDGTQVKVHANYHTARRDTP